MNTPISHQLSSPLLFNLFDQDLINELSECSGGIIINKQTQSFNVDFAAPTI